MEDNIQTIIIVIISTFLLFIFPVYMAYEKQDDISYSLAMRYTQDFVNDVRSKGYITLDMYRKYEEQLSVTGNSYDIELEHQYNRYDPITNYYKVENGEYVLATTSTMEERKTVEKILIQKGIIDGALATDSTKSEVQEYIDMQYRNNGIYKVEDTYKLASETYTTQYILNVLRGEKKLSLNSQSQNVNCDDTAYIDNCQYAYIMNVEDLFNVTIKNTNTTLAAVIYNMVTAHTLDTNTRIYVNYGGKVLASKWYGNVDYAKMKHDTLSLTERTEKVIFDEERHFYIKQGLPNYPTEVIPASNKDYSRYIIEFEAKPEDVTELREKGDVDLISYSGYNFALGTSGVSDNILAVSVGVNGISALVTNESNDTIRRAFALPKENMTFVDDEGIEQTIEVQRKTSDYLTLYAKYDSATRQIKVKLTGKEGVNDYSENISLTPAQAALWKNMSANIDNLKIGSYTVGTYTNQSTDTKYEYTIQLTETLVQLKVERDTSDNQTILSYPTRIDEYVKIKIEINEQKDGKYIANLYVDDAKVGESIKMDTLPKANIVGKTILGEKEEYFSGYIKNVKIYEMGD